jgi:hypothetical protein
MAKFFMDDREEDYKNFKILKLKKLLMPLLLSPFIIHSFFFF